MKGAWTKGFIDPQLLMALPALGISIEDDGITLVTDFVIAEYDDDDDLIAFPVQLVHQTKPNDVSSTEFVTDCDNPVFLTKKNLG